MHYVLSCDLSISHWIVLSQLNLDSVWFMYLMSFSLSLRLYISLAHMITRSCPWLAIGLYLCYGQSIYIWHLAHNNNVGSQCYCGQLHAVVENVFVLIHHLLFIHSSFIMPTGSHIRIYSEVQLYNKLYLYAIGLHTDKHIMQKHIKRPYSEILQKHKNNTTQEEKPKKILKN